MRWHKWVVLALVALALRLALPVVVAPRVADSLSRALGAPIDIGDLSFEPIDGVFTLRNVTVQAAARPGEPRSAMPVIVAERARADIQWLPLFHRTLEIREIVLDSARIEVDRFADGSFGLASLERADPVRELPAGWSFGLERITLRNSRLRVHDLAAERTGVVEATVRRADISGMRRRPTAFGRAQNLRVDALVGDGRLRVDGRYERRDEGLHLDAQVRVTDVPLAQAQSYVAHLGWTEVAGSLSGQLRWRREPRRRDVLSGRVVLRRGRVQVDGFDEAAIEARRVVADDVSIDLLGRSVSVALLTLQGTTLALRADAAAPIPLIGALTRPRGSAARLAPRAPAAGWGWMVERLATVSSRVRVVTPDGHIDLRARASGENLGSDAYWSPLRVAVAGDEIAAAFDGTARFAKGVTVEGRVTAVGIDAASLAHAAGLPWAENVMEGRASADLNVQLDAATADPKPLYARGNLRLSDFWIAGAEPYQFACGAESIELTLDELSLPEQRLVEERPGRGRTRIRFSNAVLNAPFALLTRTPEGWLLPPIGPPSAAAPEIVFASVQASAGALTIADLVPAAGVAWQVARLDGVAHGLALPALTFDLLELRGSDPRFGRLRLAAIRRSDGNGFEISGTDVSLAATAPYLGSAGLSYRFAGGQGSFDARGSVGAGSWSADTIVRLRSPVLLDPDAELQNAVGTPLESALAELRDPSGDVALRLALASAPTAAGATHTERIAAGVRAALGRATAERNQASEPEFVLLAFTPGRVDLTDAAADELSALAEILGGRPGTIVELSAETSAADRRWLAERALLGELEERRGVMGMLRALGVRDARARIRIALDERARGGPGRLSASDESTLSRLLAEARPIDEGKLAALREARLKEIVERLVENHAVASERVVVRTASDGDTGSRPAVRAEITSGPEPAVNLSLPAPDRLD